MKDFPFAVYLQSLLGEKAGLYIHRAANGLSDSPVKPVRLMTVTGNQLDYQMVITQLQSFGVPVVGTFTADGTLSKLIFGFAGSGMDVIVPETMADLARELLKPVEGEDEE